MFWSARISLVVLTALLVAIMLLSGASRPVHAPSATIIEDGTLISLPGPTADYVLCETSSICSSSNPSDWSDVLRLCDTPLDDAKCQSSAGLTATHAELFTAKEGVAGFVDEFTGHSLDSSKLITSIIPIISPQFFLESTTGPTTVGTVLVNSDPTGSGETPDPIIPEFPLGLAVLTIFMIFAYGLVRRRTTMPKNI